MYGVSESEILFKLPDIVSREMASMAIVPALEDENSHCSLENKRDKQTKFGNFMLASHQRE
jgi:hypothetical protein